MTVMTGGVKMRQRVDGECNWFVVDGNGVENGVENSKVIHAHDTLYHITLPFNASVGRECDGNGHGNEVDDVSEMMWVKMVRWLCTLMVPVVCR